MESNEANPPSTANQPLHFQHAPPSVIVREARDYKDLLERYMAQRSSYNALVSKHKASINTIGKLKSELQSCKRRLAGRNGFRPKSAGECSRIVPKENASAIQTNNLLNRLADAERQLTMLREESNQHPSADKENLLNCNQTSMSKDTNIRITDLQQQLEEKSIKLNNTNIRCEYYQEKIEAQASTLERLIELFREYKTKHHNMKRRFQSTQAENAELNNQLSELRQRKEFLEYQVSKLYEPSGTMLETMRQVRADYDALHSDYCKVVEENNRLKNNRHCCELVPLENVEKLTQRLSLAEEELERTKRLLKLQITINDALEKDSKEAGVAHCEKIAEYQAKTEELSLKSVQQLQRIRLLEGLLEANRSNERAGTPLSQTNALSLRADENVLEIHIGKASFEPSKVVMNETESFVLIDFHTFGSMLSPLAKGKNPEYDLSAIFKLNMNRSTLQALADGVQIELYVLKNNNATLFAYATTSSQQGVLAYAIGEKELTLRAVNDESPVGTLGITLKLAQPLGLAMLSDDNEVSRCPHATNRDAVKITVSTLNLDQAFISTSQRQRFFVHYDLGIGSEITNVQTQNDDGEIVFQHETAIAIPFPSDHRLDQILSTVSKDVSFVVFRGDDDAIDSKFSVVGEAQVDLRELFQKRDLSAQVFSLQATAIGVIHIIGELHQG